MRKGARRHQSTSPRYYVNHHLEAHHVEDGLEGADEWERDGGALEHTAREHGEGTLRAVADAEEPMRNVPVNKSNLAERRCKP